MTLRTFLNNCFKLCHLFIDSVFVANRSLILFLFNFWCWSFFLCFFSIFFDWDAQLTSSSQKWKSFAELPFKFNSYHFSCRFNTQIRTLLFPWHCHRRRMKSAFYIDADDLRSIFHQLFSRFFALINFPFCQIFF